ncbi:MAG: hypothetical protein ABI444_03660 [Candidatus Kapaibacterium sp.]|jgi:hypothetical protein
MIDADIIVEDPDVFLGYMREAKRPIFHNSNIFFRDIQYGVRDYFEDREGKTISSKEAIRIANDLTRSYERMGVLRKVNSNGYLLIYPDMLTPKGGTIEVLTGATIALPPAAAAPAPVKAAAPAVASAPKPIAAPPVAAATASATSAPATGAMPAGAKAPPPWLKK